jgi:hypothetical protein
MRELDLLRAISEEFQRVMPASLDNAEPTAIGFECAFPHGPEHALRVLRRLPDQAGGEAIREALEQTPPSE